MQFFIIEKGISNSDFDKIFAAEGSTIIVAPKGINVPIDVAQQLASKSSLKIELLDNFDDISIALLIGSLIGKNTTECSVNGNAKVVEKLIGKRIGSLVITKAGGVKKAPAPKKVVAKAAPVEKKVKAEPVKKDAEKPAEEKPKATRSKNPLTILKNAGIAKEHQQIMLEAIEEASDEKIGLPLQIQMKLAGIGQMNLAEKYTAAISSIYSKIKKY